MSQIWISPFRILMCKDCPSRYRCFMYDVTADKWNPPKIDHVGWIFRKQNILAIRREAMRKMITHNWDSGVMYHLECCKLKMNCVESCTGGGESGRFPIFKIDTLLLHALEGTLWPENRNDKTKSV